MDNPLVQVDPGLFIWTIVTFLVLLGLLAKFAWGPLLKALEERQETIRKSLDDADQATQDLKRLHQESAQIIAAARADVHQPVGGDIPVEGGRRVLQVEFVLDNQAWWAGCELILLCNNNSI